MKFYISPRNPDYGCDDAGNVYSFKYGKVRKLITKKHDNYFKIFLYGSVRESITVHKFNYECYTAKILDLSIETGDGMTINHINKNKHDNSKQNLELVTNRENSRFSSENEEYGISFSKRNQKYIVNISCNGKLYSSSFIGEKTYWTHLADAITIRNRLLRELDSQGIRKLLKIDYDLTNFEKEGK